MAYPHVSEIGERFERRECEREEPATTLLALASLATLVLLVLGVWVATTLVSSYGSAIAAQVGMP